MRLPPDLQHAIESETQKVNHAMLARASTQLTQRYKAADFSSTAITTDAQRAAYLAVRLPATYAAAVRVFAELHDLGAGTAIGSVLDLGAGPGTALFAAAETFPSIARATLLENDADLMELGRGIAAQSPHDAVRHANWLRHDLRSGLACERHDLVVISYTFGELPPLAAEVLLRQAWNCATHFLVLVEPGTMRGFAMVNTARSALIAAGAHILAPCPHASECPLAAAGDWCHFSQRLERTAQHRQLKGGELGYEDEKFSYVIASRQDLPSVQARIVRHPQKHGGHIQLTLCTPEGMASRTVTKSHKDDYRRARKASWGDSW